MTPAHEATCALHADLTAVCQRIDRGRRFQRELLMQPSPPADLTRAMLDAVALFESLQINYALVGGIAAMCYGRARFTEDVDFIAAPDHQAILDANPRMMREHHFDPTCTWKLYHVSGMQIDIWKDEFVAGMIQRAATTTLAGRAIRIVDVHDLIAMKLRAGRQQDDYDLSEICKHTAIDESLLRSLTLHESFERFLTIKRRSQSEK